MDGSPAWPRRNRRQVSMDSEMAVLQSRRFLIVASAAQLLIASCATPQRLPAVPVAAISQTSEALGPIRYLVARESANFEAEAKSALAKEQQWLASQGRSPEQGLPPAYYLAISGGGDNGAYGAGFI